jgi:DNA polymerase III subunit epsilon
VRDYLLFIDTETTGLPRQWHLPYSAQHNWPCSVQIAWVVYTKAGELVKSESHYIRDPQVDISPEAFRIHGISRNFLLQHGESRRQVMGALAADLDQYQPLVVAHYLQLDYHMLGAEFYRCGMDNPVEKLPVFCTMLATAPYVSNPRSKYLRLNRLYYILFQREQQNQHEALADAQATADCFFEMLRLGDIQPGQIAKQQPLLKGTATKTLQPGCLLPVLAGILLTLLFSLWQ